MLKLFEKLKAKALLHKEQKIELQKIEREAYFNQAKIEAKAKGIRDAKKEYTEVKQNVKQKEAERIY